MHANFLRPARRLLGTAAAALALLGLLLALRGAPARAQAVQPAAPDDLCDTLTAVPADECRALGALYAATRGPQWTISAGWGQAGPGAPCSWHGVSCAGGHITALDLPDNNLSGGLPPALAALNALERLDLANNRIGERAPRALCALTDTVTSADFSFNRLRALPRVAACLDALDGGWDATQTVPPTALRALEVLSDSVRLGWEPISYTAATGAYDVASSLSISGPWTLHATGIPLVAAQHTITGLTPGTAYWLSVRTHTEAAGDQANDLTSAPASLPVVTASDTPVVLAVFFAGDNDLGPTIPLVRERLRRGSALNPAARVLFLADGAADGDSLLLRFENGQEGYDLDLWDEFGAEVDTGDPAVLAWFLNHARAAAPPGARVVVALIGHGVGLAPGLDFAAPAAVGAAGARSEAPPLPREKDATATDLTSGTYLSTADLGRALADATASGSAPFDLLFLDHCFGGSLDALYEIRSAAEVFVASPNYAWLAAPYDRYLARLAPTQTPLEMARRIMAAYEDALDPGHPNAIVAVSRSQIEEMHAAASDLAAALIDAVGAGQIAPIASAVIDSRYADSAQCGEQTFHLGPPDEMIGARRFAAGLLAGFPPGDAWGVHAAAQALADRAAAVESLFVTGPPYLAPDEVWDYDDVLTLIAPLPRSLPPSVAWRASVFRGDAPFAAAYGPAPELAVQVVDGFASARDGQWDEFLAAWYEGERTPTVGQWCRYTPPALVLSESAALVGITAAPQGLDGVVLEWEEVAGALAYRLYVERPRRGGWQMVASVPPSLLNYGIDGLPPGSYAARLAVAGAEDEVIAYSDPAPFVVQQRTWLPVVAR